MASLALFLGVPEPVSNRGLKGGNGGSIKAGKISINFPKLPQPNKSPITINSPASAYPQVVADPNKQKPIIVVPEIIYPHKVKRVLVHHREPFMNYYHKMLGSINPYYMQMAQNNPYYQDFAKNSPEYQAYVNSPNIKEAMSIAKKALQSNPSMGSMPPSGKMPKLDFI